MIHCWIYGRRGRSFAWTSGGTNGDINENEEDEEAAGIDLQELEKTFVITEKALVKPRKSLIKKVETAKQQ